jgi:tetratricopeptide (TPR) repeat protein
MSDFVKMEYLESCLKTIPEVNVSRYCYKKLAELYENKKMYSEAVKYMARFAGLCVGTKEKISAVIKEAELLIKAGQYDEATYLYKKAMSLADIASRFEIKRNMIAFFKQEAEALEKSNRGTAALRIYEKIVNYVADAEKDEIKKKMLELYKRLGRVTEYIKLKAELEKNI